MNDITTLARVSTQEVTAEYQQAVDLHHKIVADIETAAAAMIDLCQNLKQMRDTRFYIQLGYESFEDYTEQAVGLKRRQAYNYITVLEKLPSHLVQSNSHLGITKLELLTQVPALERDDFVESNDLDGMSTRQMKELVEQVKQQGEQISFLQNENEQLQAAKRELDAISDQEDHLSKQLDERDTELDRLRKELKELASRPIDVAVQQPDEDTLQKIRDEARKEAMSEADKLVRRAEQQVKEAKKAALDNAQKQVDKAVESVQMEAQKAAEERFQRSLEVLEEEKAAALTRALEMEKKLKTVGDTDTIRFSVYFDEMQAAFAKIVDLIGSTRTNSPEAAAKYAAALIKALDALKAQIL